MLEHFMVNLSNIRSLTDFQRNARQAIRTMKKTGQPQVLTVNGKAELIVQDAASYQKLLDAVDRAEAVAGIKRGLQSFAKGRGMPIEESFERIRRKHGLPR
jgi:PHD/YefM family antitoxin component YafN of YafNO toxin-antitoxin module